ncbi:hypothetical protein K1719_001835 [Acacia pycnantha]|nr:hypothetical protein K1719_001835 [Acacia pycnantha]
MMEEELERMKEASQADPSIVVQPPARPPRHQKWKAARMKGDKYVNADVAEVAHKIMVMTPPMDEEAAPRFPYLAQLRQLYRDIPQISLQMPTGIVGSKTYRRLIGSKDQGGPKWYYPKCPQQPGNTECGYYVIHHMHAIISTGRLTGFQNFFDSSVAPFSDEEVDTIRDVMAKHLLQYI